MTGVLSLASAISPELGQVLFAVFLRVGAVVVFLPGLNGRLTSVRVKLAVAVVCAIAVFPIIEAPRAEVSIYWLAVSEVTNGTLIGLAIRSFVWILQILGTIAAQSTSIAQLFGGNNSEPIPALGNILLIAGVTFALVNNVHVKGVELVAKSYLIAPVGVFILASDYTDWSVSHIARVFALGFGLAAPFLIIAVIYNIGIGAVNRAMPQLMVAFIGAPLITALGLVLLAACAPLILLVWFGHFESFLTTFLGVFTRGGQ